MLNQIGRIVIEKNPQEWLRQADYDMETADAMLHSGRYFYAVFMCHISLEKALKSLYQQREQSIPPKIHNLLYFVEKLQLKIPNPLNDFLGTLNSVSVPTRYPDNLERILKEFQKSKVQELLLQGKELLRWLKTESSKL